MNASFVLRQTTCCRLLSFARHACRYRHHAAIAVTTETFGGKYHVAKISMNHPPVNSFDIPLVASLTSHLEELQTSGKIDGIIITSGVSRTFSAGLDLKELHGVTPEHLRKFWKLVQDLWLCLYSSRVPTVAAINGHCLAAGTIIAAACDHRVAAEGEYGVGVTAAKVGIIAPSWFLLMLTHLMGQRQTELALQQGLLFKPEEALKMGLVDRVCKGERLAEESLSALEPYLSVSPLSRATMKLSLRGELIDRFVRTRTEDMEKFVGFVLQDSVQKNLGDYIQKLKSKKQ